MNKSLNKPLKLTPKLHPFVRRVLDNQNLLFELAQGLGSPLNLVFPQIINENKTSFLKVFEKHQIKGKVYFAHKANRSSALVKHLAISSDSFIDVASENELKHALSCGFVGEKIGATGPKNREFISLCVIHNVLIHVDSQSELEFLKTIAEKFGKKVNISLRISNLSSQTPHSKKSRFGIDLSIVNKLINDLKNQNSINLVGFSFHLGNTILKDRINAIEEILKLVTIAVEFGHKIKFINLGGGYKVNYLEFQEEWNEFNSALKEMVLGQRPEFTWNGFSYGITTNNNTVSGRAILYNYFDHQTGPNFLDQILSSRSSLSHQTIGEIIRDQMLEIIIEPGRSLLDQCGVTLTKVLSVEKSVNDETIIHVDINRQNLAFLDHEYTVDPILICKNDNQHQPESAFILGNLCLESDLIQMRQIYFEIPPQTGDLLIFANTAGYYSDFSDNSAIFHPQSSKVAIYQNKSQNTLSWCLDEKYSLENYDC